MKQQLFKATTWSRMCFAAPRVFILFVLAAFIAADSSAAEFLKARDIPEDKSEWSKWIRDKTELVISGRYEGRFSNRFRLAKLDMTMAPRRATISLPADVATGVRLSVYGKLNRAGDRYTLDVSRIVVGQTDLALLKQEAASLPTKSPEAAFPLADRFQEVADYYDDEGLKEELTSIRLAAFARQRSAVKGDAVALRTLARRAESLSIPDRVIQTVVFESFLTDLNADSPTVADLPKSISQVLDGWNSRDTADTSVVQAFNDAAVAAYNRADSEQRKQFHRLIYRKARLAQILRSLQSDGRNASDLSNLIEDELPEETQQIGQLRNRYVDYRLERVPHLTRRQLADMVELLNEYDRSDEFSGAVESWLKAQEKRLNNGAIDGLLETAEAYFFAFERWKNKQHQQRGVELKMQAWDIARDSAPEIATQIEQQLGAIGWTRMHDRWMTEAEVKALPKDDVELAMRERRVVPGMSPAQTIAIMSGKPSRRVRFVSFRVIREIWVFGGRGSTGISVHFQRKREADPDTAVVTRVEKLVTSF